MLCCGKVQIPFDIEVIIQRCWIKATPTQNIINPLQWYLVAEWNTTISSLLSNRCLIDWFRLPKYYQQLLHLLLDIWFTFNIKIIMSGFLSGGVSITDNIGDIACLCISCAIISSSVFVCNIQKRRRFFFASLKPAERACQKLPTLLLGKFKGIQNMRRSSLNIAAAPSAFRLFLVFFHCCACWLPVH